MNIPIQIKRGNKEQLPILSPGEFGLCLDTNELFVGSSNGNLKLSINDYVITTNTDNDYSATTKLINNLYDGFKIDVKFNIDSTDNITLNLNEIGPKFVVNKDSSRVNDIKQNMIYTLCYESSGDRFVMM